MKKTIISSLAVVASVIVISGCGGGGDSGPVVAATTSFPLQVGYKARISSGATDNYSISGTCSGTATVTSAAAVVSTFQSVAGYSATTTTIFNFTNCTPASVAITGAGYYDVNYSPIGSAIDKLEFTKFAALPQAIPASVKVGDTAAYGTLNTYTDSTMTTATGQRIISYVIEADGANTAVANLITKGYNATGQLLFTQQSRYRMAADGTLTAVSIDVQYSTTNTNHIIYTKQ